MFLPEDFTTAEKIGQNHFLYPLAKSLEEFPHVSVLHDPKLDSKGDHTLGVTTHCSCGDFDEGKFGRLLRILATAAEIYNCEVESKGKGHHPFVEVNVGALGTCITDAMAVQLLLTEACNLDLLCAVIDTVAEDFFEQAQTLAALAAEPHSNTVN